MPGTTPIYGLPFQEPGDPPHGPNLGEDLAAAVETELNRIDGLAAVLTDTDWIAMTDPGGDWTVSGARYRKLNGVVYVVGGWVRDAGANPTAPTLFTLPVGFRPSELIPTIWRHTNNPVTTGIISAAGSVQMDSTTVLATNSVRFAAAFPADQ